MPRPKVLVIAVDGLRANALGAYGNTSFGTPTLDRLATQSLLSDACFADSPQLSLLYGGYWRATSALRVHTGDESNRSLPAVLAEVGYTTRLITDCRQITEFPVVQNYSEAIFIDDSMDSDAVEIEQTCTGRVLSEMFDCIAERESAAQRPLFLWTHLRCAYGPWDAPQDLAMSLIDEDDMAPEPSVVPPERSVDRSAQADEIYSETCRYAAQVMALDSLLAPLCDLLDGDASGEWICVLMGVRGFPLGEHGQLGGIDGRLYSEQLHVPLLVRFPNCRGGLSRVSQFVHPVDLPATILRFLDIESPVGDGIDFLQFLDQSENQCRSHLLAEGQDGALSIRTPSWYMRVANRNLREGSELFVKPDDRWEANDVASLCSEVADELKEFAIAERMRIAAGGALDTEHLPAHLVESMH